MMLASESVSRNALLGNNIQKMQLYVVYICVHASALSVETYLNLHAEDAKAFTVAIPGGC